MDYLTDAEQERLIENLIVAREHMGKSFSIMYGYGPKVQDVSMFMRKVQERLFDKGG